MRLILAALGYINGKISIKCIKCLRLKHGNCLGRKISEDEQLKPRTCGLWKKRHVWIRRQSTVQDPNVKLKQPID